MTQDCIIVDSFIAMHLLVVIEDCQSINLTYFVGFSGGVG
jgi:pimeloyl-CoA synthetase